MTEQEWMDELNDRYVKHIRETVIWKEVSDEEMKERLENDDWSYEEPHIIIDELMCDILKDELGFKDIVKRYKKMRKWFA